MNRFVTRLNTRRAIREAVDNLPDGLCFFDQNGLPVLCNRQMHRLSFSLTGEDIYTLPRLREALLPERLPADVKYENAAFLLPDGSAWSFSFEDITIEGESYTQVTAFEVSELLRQQELLKKANEAKDKTIASLEHIQENIIDITREEELLAMKMRLHNQFGYNLQAIRRFSESGCPEGEKAGFIREQRALLQKIVGGVGERDDTDAVAGLRELASSLDMRLTIHGAPPKDRQARELLAAALREQLINTVSHAGGREVTADLAYQDGCLTATVTNDGQPPEGEVVEGGGLSSLRKKIENTGGQMVVHSRPRFALVLTVRCDEQQEGELA